MFASSFSMYAPICNLVLSKIHLADERFWSLFFSHLVMPKTGADCTVKTALWQKVHCTWVRREKKFKPRSQEQSRVMNSTEHKKWNTLYSNMIFMLKGWQNRRAEHPWNNQCVMQLWLCIVRSARPINRLLIRFFLSSRFLKD